MRTKSKYTPSEVDEALVTLVALGGNTIRASEALGIPDRTLYSWRADKHRDRYLELAERERPRLEAIAIERAIQNHIEAGELQTDVADIIRARVRNPDTTARELKELAGTLQHLATAGGINMTKYLEVQGRPTQIIANVDGADIINRIRNRFPGLVVDGTAEEEPTRQIEKDATAATSSAF